LLTATGTNALVDICFLC